MDNVTHTLIGLAAAEGVATWRKKARAPLWIASAVANNLPDLDVLETSVIFRDRLGYLLHHRGHTHTFLAAPLQAIIWLAVLWLIWRKREGLPWKEISLLALLGVPLHIFADFWNSYGVHPFWPWDNNWVYGDMVFIVEPWIWVLFLPSLAAAAASKASKRVFYGLLAGILLLGLFHPAVPLPLATLLLLGAGLSWAVSRLGPRPRILIPIFAFLLALAGMKAISETLRARHAAPGALLTLSPFPANPLCWAAIETRLDNGNYVATLSTLAPFPALKSAASCPPLQGSGDTTAPLTAVPELESAAQANIRRFQAPAAGLTLLAKDCVGEALLRFARAPFWKEEGGQLVVGDLRFDRDKDLGFTEFVLGGTFPCPASLPPWTASYHPSRLNPL